MAILVVFYLKIGSQLEGEKPLEQRLELFMKLVQRHVEHKEKGSIGRPLVLGWYVTVSTVPATLSCVAALVAFPVSIVVGAVDVILWSALCHLAIIITVPPVKETGRGVALNVANAIIEQVGTSNTARAGIAMLPRVYAKITVSIVEITGQSVADLVTDLVARFALAVVLLAPSAVLLKVNITVISVPDSVNGDINATIRRFVKDFTVLAAVVFQTSASIISRPVNALSTVLTPVVHALIPVVGVTVGSGGSGDAFTPVSGHCGHTGPAVVTGIILTAIPFQFAVVAAIALHTGTHMAVECAGARASVHTRTIRTEILLRFTMSAHPAGFTIASIIIDQLATISSSILKAGIGQTFINVAFAPRPSKSWLAVTLESSNLVLADSTVMTGTVVAFVPVIFAELTAGARRTGTGEPVNQIVADSAVLAVVGLAVINVQLTLGPHVAGCTGAAEVRFHVVAGCSVQTGVGRAGIGFMLTVGAPVSFLAVTSV